MIRTCNHSAVVHLGLHISWILEICYLEISLIMRTCERCHVEERTFYVARVPVTLVDDVQKISTCMHESVVRSTPFTSTNSFTFVKADVYSFCLNDRMQKGKGNLLRLEASSLCLLYASLIT